MLISKKPAGSTGNNNILRQGSWAIYILALLYYLAFIIRTGFPVGDVTFFSLFDDAMIAMRYARNMAEGHGLVWNTGEYIEGYTNFLWTLWMAVIHLFPVAESKTSLLVALSGALILLVNIHIIRKIASEFTANPFVILSSMALVAFSYSLIYWTLRGMEVGIICLFLNYAILLALQLQRKFTNRKFVLLLAVGGLMLLTRTDCLLLFMITGSWVAFSVDAPRKRTTILLFAGTLVLFLGGHTIFRLLYYHDPLPNTFYLKVSGTPMTDRVLRGLLVYFKWLVSFFIPVLIILLTGIVTQLRKMMDTRYLLLVTPFLMMSAYSVYVGGDAWEWMPYANRYITLTIPVLLVFTVIVLQKTVAGMNSMRLLLILTGSFCLLWYGYMMILLPSAGATLSGFYPTVIWLWGSLRYPAGVLVLCLVLTMALFYFKTDHEKKARLFAPGVMLTVLIIVFLGLEGLSYIHWCRYNALHVSDDRKMVKTGLIIQSLTTPQTTIAVVWGGAIPYFAHRYTVDLMGKMDRTIAKSNSRLKEFFPGHTKWNYGFSLFKYHPDLVLQLFYKTPIDDRRIEAMGYDHIREDLFIRKGSYGKMRIPYARTNPQRLYELIIQK
ncbi:MAG: hypothetical protein NT040_05690 [Bacteroidetes bacterium]|nr:hypothetical protein [Bacteroidota bacterium]